MNLLEVKNICKTYGSGETAVKALKDVSFSVPKGEYVAVVGESGSGKSVTGFSVLRLVDAPGRIVKGRINFLGQDMARLSEEEMRALRGSRIAMIFQDPMMTLNPVLRIDTQMIDAVMAHESVSRSEARVRARDALGKVGIPSPDERLKAYPHQFSGGMKQRVVIAIALACSPELLIADEPTTALDVTIQAQVLDMMNELKARLGTSVILISHDLGVVAEMCDEVAVIYAGEIVEIGTARDVFKHMSHPYTIGMFDSLPDLNSSSKRLKLIPGLMPDPTDLPKGCKFAPRCAHCTQACMEAPVPLKELEPGHYCRCLYPQHKEERV